MCRRSIIWISTLLLLLMLCVRRAIGLYETAPHIIVIMADDLGWNDVGFHGSNQIPTPNIDALGYNGIILNRHYVLPSSTPSRSAFLTGLYPIRIGMQGDGILGGEPRGLPLDIKILPEHLRGLGYTTKLIGKWHMGYHTPQYTPLHRGFDSFLGFYNSHISYYDYNYSNQNMSGYDLHRGDDPAHGINREYATDLFTEEAIKIIENHELPRPLYLQISHLAVHAPLEQPVNEYNDREFTHIREPNRRKYARMVSRLDDSVGRIVHALGDKGMLRDSLILFLTDNGAASVGRYRNWGSNYPLRGTKYTLYEGGVRSVAALWSPRIQKAARISNQLIHVTDWLPTLYSAAGGDLKDLGEIDGIDQWRLLSEGHGRGRDKLLLNIDEVRKTEGAIYSRFKLLRGSVDNGYYDGYYGDSGITIETPPYTDIVLKSSVSQSITYHLGGPVTQPSTMMQLRREATVQCRPNMTYYHRHIFTTCNVTECLFDIVNDPCEMKNVADAYPRIARDLDLYLEHYGHILIRQIKLPVDWLADPRRRNNTWEPWIHSGAAIFVPNTAAIVGNLVYCVHILIVFTSTLLSIFT
ncbi:arylsulfatase B-like isoform X1 [Osmia bicornis bicornis]|uniref:arylsulfatase B-like isoform X1 n=2 Tax=Osmia bicornis bicornis TaxID=1437191 RepID=UPI001EAE85E8|nr:arylsulfatase B-like isoform X1 [Osmia bicornis bicornis]